MTPAPAPGPQALVFVVITVLLDVIGFSLIVPVLPALLMDLTGQGVNQVAVHGGWLAFAYAAAQFLCAPVLGNLSDRFGRRPVLLAAVGTLGVDYIIMGLAPTLSWLFLGRTLAGMAGASFTPAYAYVADISPPEKRAQNFSMIGAAFGLGFILGPAVGGLLGEFGPRTPFFVAAGLSALNLAYGLLVLPETLS
ncbi:MAG TPA: MFS transporter, partial [Gemmatimonadales bacterium]|nr:MFS transporter [Gemmatimonadales bacterium]